MAKTTINVNLKAIDEGGNFIRIKFNCVLCTLYRNSNRTPVELRNGSDSKVRCKYNVEKNENRWKTSHSLRQWATLYSPRSL